MVEELVQYPDERIKNISVDVRLFDHELEELLQNMHDTMNANGLSEVSAIELAYPQNVVLLKNEDGSVAEFINPRLIVGDEAVYIHESCNYFRDVGANVRRYDSIRVVYQDRDGYNQSERFSGEYAHRLQKQIDLLFGGTFLDKLDKKSRRIKRKEIEKTLGKVERTPKPVYYYRDRLLKVIGLLFFVTLALDIAAFFTATRLAVEPFVVMYMILIPAYILVASYESKQDSSSTECQKFKIMGNTLFEGAKLSFLVALMIINT